MISLYSTLLVEFVAALELAIVDLGSEEFSW
jgi:hypothetical protein